MDNKKLILSAFLAANFLIAPAAYADGYPDTGPAAQAQMKKIVKKASIKKPRAKIRETILERLSRFIVISPLFA